MLPRLSAALIHTRRRALRTLRDRASMSNTLITPVIMLLIMRVLFGDLIAASQGRETPDLLGVCVMMALGAQWMNSTYCASETIRERRLGFAARIAVSPTGTGPMVLGDGIFYAVRFLIASLVTLTVGVAVGARFHSIHSLLAVLLALFLSSITTALMATWLAYLTDKNESLMMATPLLMCLLFLSAGLVQPDSFVSVVQPIVRNNPVTHLIQGLMAIDAGLDTGHHMVIATVWVVAAAVTFAVAARLSYRRRRTHLA